jgi:hypothetical protein
MKIWLAALLFACTALAQAEVWQVGLIGDVPYSDDERRDLPRLLASMADKKVDFIAHIGDFKHGKDRCDDALFADRHQLFSASRVPFVYIPGDNEWADCGRLSNGGYDPLERLDKLRHLFWADNQSLGQKKLALERQPGAYREHARFRLGPILFVTLNLPGGNNNFGNTEVASPEFIARNPVVLAWVKENFALARRENLAGIVLLFQANPGFKHFSQGLAHNGYRDFLTLLDRETANFAGQVLVVHGDTHDNRIDHPLRDSEGKRLKHFTRVETFGYPLMGWTQLTIDSEADKLFSFENHAWPSGKK